MSHRRASDLTSHQRETIIRGSEIAAGLDREVLALLARGSQPVEFRRRDFIYRSGDTADALYVIERGRVKICSIEEATGREAVIDIVGRGALFGESSLYSAGVREKCAIAYENVRLLRIPAGVYREGMAASRCLYDYTFRMVGQRLSRAERRVVDFALDAIPARLALLLALPHREIASIVGSTRESVTVRLNALRRAGIIDFVDRKILIKNPADAAAV